MTRASSWILAAAKQSSGSDEGLQLDPDGSPLLQEALHARRRHDLEVAAVGEVGQGEGVGGEVSVGATLGEMCLRAAEREGRERLAKGVR